MAGVHVKKILRACEMTMVPIFLQRMATNTPLNQTRLVSRSTTRQRTRRTVAAATTSSTAAGHLKSRQLVRND